MAKIITRRSFIRVLTGIIAAPAVVKAASLMPVKAVAIIDPIAELERRMHEAYLATERAIMANIFRGVPYPEGDIVRHLRVLRMQTLPIEEAMAAYPLEEISRWRSATPRPT